MLRLLTHFTGCWIFCLLSRYSTMYNVYSKYFGTKSIVSVIFEDLLRRKRKFDVKLCWDTGYKKNSWKIFPLYSRWKQISSRSNSSSSNHDIKNCSNGLDADNTTLWLWLVRLIAWNQFHVSILNIPIGLSAQDKESTAFDQIRVKYHEACAEL